MIKSPKITIFPSKKNPKSSTLKKQPTQETEERQIKKNRISLFKLKDQMMNQIEKVEVPKKFVNFVKKNAKMLPKILTKEQSKMLLPKLQQITFISKQAPSKEHADKKFKEINKLLSNNMVQFMNTTESQKMELWAIQIQTQKCYKNIPKFYFECEVKLQDLNLNLKLTKSHSQINDMIYSLQDYADEVQFNINQQVGAKMKIFMKFVLCMNSINELVDMNLKKIAITRAHNNILRDIVVSKSICINQKRNKKQNLQYTLQILERLKKMKQLQNKLMNQMVLGNLVNPESKNKISQMYHEYCQIHNAYLKKYCCSGRPLCKYWDISYYVDRGYQQNFMKIIRKYFFEIIQVQKDIESYNRTHINKKQFMSTPANSSPFGMELDSSYEVDYDIEITIKENIEKEILSVFEQGMHKYSFSTETIGEELKNILHNYKQVLFNRIINQSSVHSQVPISSISNILPQNSLEQMSNDSIEKGLRILPWVKYQKILDIVINRMEQINKRIFSLIDKILIKLEFLQSDQPERSQVIAVYMTQFILISLQFADSLIQILLRCKIYTHKSTKTIYKSKGQSDKYQQFEAQSMKKLVNICKKCQSQYSSFKKYHPFVSKEYAKLVNQGQDNEKKWIPKILTLKQEIVKLAYENVHKSIIAKELKQKLQEDNWQPIKTSKQIFECIGYIIGGKLFIKQQQNKNKNMLSSSLLLERQLSESNYDRYDKQIYSSRFKVGQYSVTLDEKQFKISSSTLEMVKFLHHYLQLYDEIPEGKQSEDKKFELHGKVTQLILMYNQYVRDLILKSEALKFNKIKSKSITARHLLICYVQLRIVDLIYCGKILQQRISISPEQCSVMHNKLSKTMNQIQTKFRNILSERIQESIKEIKVKDENVVETEPFLSVIKNINSSIQLFKQLLYDEDAYSGFIDISTQSSSWVQSLLNRVNKGIYGKETKVKCFKYLLYELQPNIKYLPNLKIAVQSVVY